MSCGNKSGSAQEIGCGQSFVVIVVLIEEEEKVLGASGSKSISK
jgi:hypothetical protein